MKKVIVLIVIVCWFGSGLLGFGLMNGYFRGKFGSEDQSQKIVPYLDHYVRMFFLVCLGPLNLVGQVFFLGNDRDRWQYPMTLKP